MSGCFELLPDELYKVIFSFARLDDMEVILAVSKKWRALALTVDDFDWSQFEALADACAKKADSYCNRDRLDVFSTLQGYRSTDIIAFRLAHMALNYYTIARKRDKKFSLAQTVYYQQAYIVAASPSLRELIGEILTEKRSHQAKLFQQIGALVAFIAVLWMMYKFVTDL